MLLSIVKVRVGLLDQGQAKAVWVDTIGGEEIQKVAASTAPSRWLSVLMHGVRWVESREGGIVETVRSSRT
jgi:hypothetical protein